MLYSNNLSKPCILKLQVHSKASKAFPFRHHFPYYLVSAVSQYVAWLHCILEHKSWIILRILLSCFYWLLCLLRFLPSAVAVIDIQYYRKQTATNFSQEQQKYTGLFSRLSPESLNTSRICVSGWHFPLILWISEHQEHEPVENQRSEWTVFFFE